MYPERVISCMYVLFCYVRQITISHVFIGTEIVATVDCNRTGIPSIYHVKCEVLIKVNTSMKICECCKKQRKTLTAMASQEQKDTDWTDPSSHTAYVHLNTPEKMKG